jgi:hypothetical protein
MKPSENYFLLIGKAFEDMRLLSDLKAAQVTGNDVKQVANLSDNRITLSDSDVKLLKEQKGARKVNILDIIFDARYELGTGLKDSP